MITVIIAGGSGTRLWPLSTAKNPKQLLALNGERSLVQQAYDRAKTLGDTVLVVAEASHAEALRAQLPQLADEAFLIEPGRRGTAHCIVFALDFIARNFDSSESVAFVHSDHNIRDIQGFKRSFVAAEKASQSSRCISLIGIEPTYPATGFGYIERNGVVDTAAGVYEVAKFKEKPDFQTATKFYESGNYLWNCGYFVGSVDIFLDKMSKYAPDLLASYQSLAEIAQFGSDEYSEVYLSLDSQVIDVALIEKAQGTVVVSASFDWADIGNFKDLHDIVAKDELGNYQKGENVHTMEVENSYIRNEEPNRPVAVIGLDNIVVVNTPDGVLVARKDIAAKCGDIAKKLH